MFKKLILGCGALLLALSLQVQAASFQKGVNYKVLDTVKSEQPQVREFFSFWCGHCFQMQPMFARLKDHLKGKAEFVPTPVSLLGGPMAPESQKAYAAAVLLGVGDEFSRELFDRMHLKNAIPQSPDDFAAVFAAVGVDKASYEKERTSFPAAGMVASFDQAVSDSGIDAVPEILVNNKYLATMESVNSEEEFFSLIDYLLTLK